MAIELVKEKPPLGIAPRFFRNEERLKEIADAICRYISHPAEIPMEWIVEYNEIVIWMHNHDRKRDLKNEKV